MAKAKVQTFFGPREYEIESVWFWNGKPERLFCRTEKDTRRKYKMDEEPFELPESLMLYAKDGE
jgi:hypothetical protein